ncbi:hypothetical protein JOF28_002247 [Leucobacter exalbidus]|uniref:DUF4244 domain-containing protein n=1 Tax=Leucobacter exalbidus TaxID=662960 RepID=A0A940T1M8_9MICO|nr:DUF4244 domain-containing protein [Leucobacter exalbidus]MBP1327015.1 hypothetical protein [Leucobacter exalbidus]
METKLQLVPELPGDTHEVVPARPAEPHHPHTSRAGTAPGDVASDDPEADFWFSFVAQPTKTRDAMLRRTASSVRSAPAAMPRRLWPRPSQRRAGGGLERDRAQGHGRVKRWRQLISEERGAVTAEYAIVIMAAVAFAGILVAILRSNEIRAMLVQLVENALGAAG